MLREDNRRIEREKDALGAELAAAREQLKQISGMGEKRPSDLFAPTSIDIASLSGGADFDGKPGDDGVVVYLRPLDADRQVVKVPGAIGVQLLDNSDLAAPRVLAVCEVHEPEALRTAWMGVLGTNHYVIRCPFPENAELPASRKLSVNATFADFLTGRQLTASKVVAFTPAGSNP